MDYAYARDLFNRRRKNSDFKRWNNYCKIVQVDDGLQFQYDDNTPIATISPSNVWTMHRDISARDQSGKMLMAKIIGKYEIAVSHDSRSHYQNKLRVHYRNKHGTRMQCGYKPGLQYDAANRVMLNADAEGARTLNRATYKQIKPLLAQTSRLAEILLKIDTDAYRGAGYYRSRTEWQSARQQLIKDASNGLVDDNYDFTPVIEAALRVAVGNIGGYYHPVPKLNADEVIEKARSYLRPVLINALGAYEYQHQHQPEPVADCASV